MQKNNTTKRFQRRGVTTIEYGILAALIAVVSIASIQLLGGNIHEGYCNISRGISNSNNMGNNLNDPCSTLKSTLQGQMQTLTQNIAQNEKNYISAYEAATKVIQQGKNYHAACANGDQTACAEYNTLVNGGPTAQSWSSETNSPYNQAINNLNNAYNQLTWSGNNSIGNTLNNMLSAEPNSGSVYQQLIQQYGQTAADNAVNNFLQTDVTDPTTGQKTPLSSMFSMEQSASSGWGVINNGDAAISDFMNTYPKTIFDNINWNS